MRKEVAHQIIKEFNLISHKKSNKVLYSIINNLEIPDRDLSNLSKPAIALLKNIYLKYLDRILSTEQKVFPRNLPFYYMIKEAYPLFSWTIEESRVRLRYPLFFKLNVSLLSLLLGRVNQEYTTLLHQRYSSIYPLSASVIKKLYSFMEASDMVYPTETEMSKIVAWLQCGLQGEPVTVFCPICPDYAVEATANPRYPVRHTFNDLGEGLGQIAQRILKAIPLLQTMNHSLKLKANIIVGMGDFEALINANLDRMKIDQEEYLRRIRSSVALFAKEANKAVKINMITEMCGGMQAWLDIFKLIKQQFEHMNFGATGLTFNNMREIARKRSALYSRWYGKKDINEYVPIAVSQCAEYAVLGYVLPLRYKNCLVLGADNPLFAPLYSFQVPIPTLYLTRYYC